jgi:hypothetical protein
LSRSRGKRFFANCCVTVEPPPPAAADKAFEHTHQCSKIDPGMIPNKRISSVANKRITQGRVDILVGNVASVLQGNNDQSTTLSVVMTSVAKLLLGFSKLLKRRAFRANRPTDKQEKQDTTTAS